MSYMLVIVYSSSEVKGIAEEAWGGVPKWEKRVAEPGLTRITQRRRQPGV